MTYRQIATMPTKVTPEMWEKTAGGGIHESCLRGYQITQKLRELLEAGTPVTVVLELLDLMESPDEFREVPSEWPNQQQA